MMIFLQSNVKLRDLRYGQTNMLLSLNQRNVIIDYVKSYHSVAVLRICITALFVSSCNRVMFLYNTQNIFEIYVTV